jgi:hypothetical protein
VRESIDLRYELRSLRRHVQRRQDVHRRKVQVPHRRDGLQRPLCRSRQRSKPLRQLRDEVRAPAHLHERELRSDLSRFQILEGIVLAEWSYHLACDSSPRSVCCSWSRARR